MSAAAVVAAPELRAGALRLALRPDLGGSVAGLWHGGVPVLRSTNPPGDLRGPRESACFPLVPYSNRLAHRRFAWQGREHTTRPNFDDSPHSLHGVGWRRAWTLDEVDDRRATLAYRHAPDADWPFAFAVEQRIELGPTALRLALRIVNTDATPQPVGLGWHPYFLRRPGSRLRMTVARRWEKDDLQLPTDSVAQESIDAEVATLALDHGFDGWHGPARIDDERFSLSLCSDLDRAVVFTPAGKPHFCVEPVSHVTDAIHAPDPASRGLRILRPGDAFEAAMTLEIEPRR